MAYSTIAQVKEILLIPSATTTYDAEIQNIIALVDSEIDTILKKYTDLPLHQDIASELQYISAEWAAGVFKNRRAGSKDQPLGSAENARTRLRQFVEAHFKTSFERV